MHSLTGFHPMTTEDADKVISLAPDRPIWDRVFGVFRLVIVGSEEKTADTTSRPSTWRCPWAGGNQFGFVCSPEHATRGASQRIPGVRASSSGRVEHDGR
jgi:hypothetical protein